MSDFCVDQRRMMDSPLTISTSKAVFSAIDAYCQAENLGCVIQKSTLRLGALQFLCCVADPSQDDLSHQPDSGRAAYFGDSYRQLELFANQGWRTLWYNPEGCFAPTSQPLHDVEFFTLEGLEQIPVLLNKPSLHTCQAWLDLWEVPERIRRHAQLVAWMAYVIAVMLRNRGIHLDPILAYRGGLLHDLDKLHTLDSSQHHGDVGAKFVQEQGYLRLGEVMREHVMRPGYCAQKHRQAWESKLVFFCDKLAEEARIVPFYVRLEALKQRYPDFVGMMNTVEPDVWALNDEICSILSITSHEKLIKKLLRLQNN